MRMSIGVDLHKTQFTECILSENRKVKESGIYLKKGLEDHKSFGNAAQAVIPLFETIDQVHAQVKKLEKVIEELDSEDEEVELLMTIPGVRNYYSLYHTCIYG